MATAQDSGQRHNQNMLTDRDLAILAFEADQPERRGTKQSEIEQRFGLSPTRYYQLMNSIIDNPDALEADAVTVHRLLRQRGERVKARAARTFS